ncbi:MAG: FAD-binding protein, partial [Burkholderiales bacterium]|nr:FAD-binding protein [Burkholderiales bacterium]
MNASVHVMPIDFERQRAVCSALRAFMPEHNVLFDREDVTPYECDGLSAYRQVPMVVALPENEAQVCEILETCHAMRVPVVARGAGTGLSGGALPLGNGVLLSLAKLKNILAIDPQARIARVQPGVRN